MDSPRLEAEGAVVEREPPEISGIGITTGSGLTLAAVKVRPFCCCQVSGIPIDSFKLMGDVRPDKTSIDKDRDR